MRRLAHDDAAEQAGADRIDGDLTCQILAHVRDVVLVMSRDRTILYANPPARRLLARRDALRINRGRLVANSSAQAVRLERAIDRICTPAAVGEDEVLVFARSSAPPLVLSLRCMDGGNGGTILLVGSDLNVEPVLVLSSLRRCFGLTTTEAQVAAAVAAGTSSTAIAVQRGVRVNTIRTQIKAVAAKLGCATQSQIGAIVRGVPLSARDPF